MFQTLQVWGVFVIIATLSFGANILLFFYQLALTIMYHIQTLLFRYEESTQRLFHGPIKTADGLKLLWMPFGKFIDLSYGKVHYQLLGSATAHLIVLMPQETLYSYSWLPFAKNLVSSGFQVLVFDFYGSGHSESPPATVDASFYMQNTLELVEALGFMKPFTLCGASTSALMAMAIAADSPEKISRLILISPGGFPPSSLMDMHTVPLYLLRFMVRTSLGPILIQTIKHATFLTSLVIPSVREFVNGFPDYLHGVDTYLSSLQQYTLHLGFQFQKTPLFAEYLEMMVANFPIYGPVDQQVLDCVANHPKKVLILWGTRNYLHSCRMAETYQKLIPQATIKLLDGATQLMITDRWPEMSKIVTTWLSNDIKGKSL